MRFSASLVLAALLSVSNVAAFPSLEAKRDAAAAGCPYAKRDAEADAETPRILKERKKRAEDIVKRQAFDPLGQRISTSGQYAFVPPNFGAGDIRGPCPGLNALANHGYLPHNGIATATQYIQAVNKVYGMGIDLGTFLAVYGTTMDGNPLSLTPGFSMGGPAPVGNAVAGNSLGLIGQPLGLSGSHNKYEGDTSPTRGDLYISANNYALLLPQAKTYISYIKEGLPVPLQYSALFGLRELRFQDSVNRNPYFFFPPFAGILASPAGTSFPVEMMSNHSLLNPLGSLSVDNFKSFFALSGNGDGLSYQEGWERIPDNWYRRPDDFTIPEYLATILEFGAQDSRLLSPGGNLNGVNSFGFVDLNNITGGIYNTASLTKGNNFECFAYQIMQETVPDAAKGLLTDVGKLLSSLSNLISQRSQDLGCPQLKSYDDAFLKTFPGYQRSSGS